MSDLPTPSGEGRSRVLPLSPAEGPLTRSYGYALTVAGLVLLLGMLVQEAVLAVALILSVCALVVVAGSPFRTLLLALSLQVVFSATELYEAGFWVGPFLLRADMMLMAWVVFAWAATREPGKRYGSIGYLGGLITALLLLTVGGFFHGIATDGDPRTATWFLFTLGGYVVFFPAVEVLASAERRKAFLYVLFLAGAVSGLVFLLRGVAGEGLGLYYRSTGLRIALRQPNAMAVILMLLVSTLWTRRRTTYWLIALGGGALMLAGIVISQSRALWLGIALAGLMALILGLARRKGGLPRIRPTLSLVLIVLVGLGVLSLAGVLTTEQVASRAGAETGSYLLDSAILARFIAWGAVLEKAEGTALVVGHGLGETYSCYRPSAGGQRTLGWVDGSFFQALLNLGLLGVAALGSLYVLALWKAAKLFLVCPGPEDASLCLGIFCSLVVLFTASITGPPIIGYRFSALWACLLAMLHVVDRKRMPEER
ncbi:hypothetical protein GF402_11045 [Candidatus Fermentibacteria bacterium]|nr:hypothetical protein [Candidatus Fermentibacteria bacterium]